MEVLQVIFVFVCFCFISAAFEIGKDIVKAKLMKRTANQVVDTVFTSVLRSALKYRLDAKTVFGKAEKERGGNDEVSNMQ